MDIAQKLDDVNRSFYERHAASFDRTRQHGWAGWVPHLPLLPNRPLSVLDVGSGNGRLADFLGRHWCADGRSVAQFTGLERCQPLRDQAERRTLPFAARWVPWCWSQVVTGNAAPPDAAHDWVALFGVLHHVYGYARRVELLRWAAASLRPGGVLSVSLWDFGAHARWDDKTLDWSHFAPQWGLDPAQLEPGDTLLGWRGDDASPRFCHWVPPAEETRLVADVNAFAGLEDGVLVGQGADFNRYWSWTRTRGA